MIVVCGATGFIGQALGPRLPRDTIGLGRRARPGDAAYASYRAGDLFSQAATRAAVAGADVIVYLVHSMMPAARLTQGRFEDVDLLCADNVARAAAEVGARQIVYLGGLMPHGAASTHLRSRDEVARTLGAYGVPVTTLRAGLVIGPGGSSMELLTRLVERLPVMVTPRWTATRTQPIALSDVVDALRYVIGRPDCVGETFDVGTPEVVTYRELMQRTAAQLGRRIPMLPLPVLSPGLSRLWLSLITGAPRELAAPLVQSLSHEMVARDRRLEARLGRPMRRLDDALGQAMAERPRHAPTAFVGAAAARGDRPATVFSVQRLRLPPGRDACWAGTEYARWLHGVPGLAATTRDDGTIALGLRGVRWPLLELTPRTATPDRAVFDVTGGLLARGAAGRFEVRRVGGGSLALTIVDGFVPALPWWIYRLTQAPLHALVMAGFGRHLARPATAFAPGVIDPPDVATTLVADV
jgi:uncharacterized protein YbjT (DUF2867 family)